MSWIWLVLGIVFGWWTHALFGSAPPSEPATQDQQESDASAALTPSFYSGLLAGVFLGWLVRAGVATDASGQVPTAAGQPAPPAPTPPQPATAAANASKTAPGRYFVAYFVALVVILLAASHPYLGWFSAIFYWLEGLILSPRVLAVLSGAAVGFWAHCHHEAISVRAADFYEALLGSETKSSWALQSVVAILALALLVLAIKPDLLDHLESFKAGEVEAKFASVTSATRQANSITNELAKQSTIKQWIDFRKSYLSGSPRDNALEFDHSAIKEQRKLIRNTLFEYVEPLARLVDCLNEDDRLDRLRRNEDFVRLAIVFRNRILGEAKDGDGAGFKESDWMYLLGLIDEQIRKAMLIVTAEVSDAVVKNSCTGIDEIEVDSGKMLQKTKDNAKLLGEQVHQAVDKLKADSSEKRYHLSFLDPYFICAVSDFIALTLSNTEKANFLMEIKSQYPKELELVQPGIISIYYYLSDSKLKSEAPWPLDEKIEELDVAMAGAEHMITMSDKRADEVRREAIKTGKTSNTVPYDEISEVYYVNKLTFLNRYLEIFCQHSLSGDTLSGEDRYRWARYYKLIERVIGLWEPGTWLDIDGLAEMPTLQNQADWKKTRTKILPEVRFDTKVAMALSAVLLTERNNRATPQACSVGQYYLGRARDMLTEVVSNESEKSRLRGYLLQIGARVKASCPDAG